MKWLIILCNLIIFSFGVLRAETNLRENVMCGIQLVNAYIRAGNCWSEILENNGDFNELKTTILEYSGDEAAIQALAAKYCPILEQLTECTIIRGDLNENCISPFERDTKKIEYDVSKAVLNYACANNATALIRVLENNGSRTIWENDKTFECVKTGADGKIAEDREQGLNIIAVCNGLDRVRECYANLVQDHENKNLIPTLNELHVLIRETVKCPTVTEN